MTLQPSGFFDRYSESVNPSVINGFAAAALRLGHSMVRNNFTRTGPSPIDQTFDQFFVKNHYFNTTPYFDICQGGVDAIARGLLTDPAEKVDR